MMSGGSHLLSARLSPSYIKQDLSDGAIPWSNACGMASSCNKDVQLALQTYFLSLHISMMKRMQSGAGSANSRNPARVS
jgi:hypothetical protein